ncbi:membrane protein insertase YidC [bacterium]|nr:membrane protein insertase YidC [bacterium]
MDRNTRIGFGLILLLLIIWSVWMARYQPAQRPAPGAEKQASEQPAATSEPAPEAPAPSAQVAPAAPAGPRQFVVVETDRARYLLDSWGAQLRRIELLDYAGVGSEHVELLAAAHGDTAAALGVELELPAGTFASGSAAFTLVNPPAGGRLRIRGDEQGALEFRLQDGQGGSLVKRFQFHGDSYDIGLAVEADLQGGFGQAQAIVLDWSVGLAPTEKNRKDDLSSFQSVYRVGDQQEKKSLRNFRGEAPALRSEEGTLQWVATKSKYFLAALVPNTLQNGNALLVGDHGAERLGWRARFALGGNRTRYAEEFQVYAGPLLFETLKAHGRGLEHLVDMGTLIRPISLAIKWLMDFLSRFIPNYGLNIILLSIFTKVLFYRLTHKSLKSMKDMQAIQPELKSLQDKYKSDRERLNREMLALYKRAGVNPLSGCLPLLLQMPVFFALYRVLRGAVELRGAGFMLWIDDLSNMDVIYALPFAIPLLGGFIDNAISVLPILMGVSVWVQQKLGGSGLGMGAESPQAAQMAILNKIMPVFMTFVFYRMPSGLVLYWLVNNILQAAQQYYIHKGLDKPRVVSAGA